jgi:hypothetical protein
MVRSSELSFALGERHCQIAFQQNSASFSPEAKKPGRIGERLYPFAIDPAHWKENLFPPNTAQMAQSAQS